MGGARFELREQQKNIRELVDAQVPLERTPAADLLGFQIEKNFEYFKKEDPDAKPQVIALRVAHHFLDVPMYNRISGQPMFGPKSYERIDTYEEMKQKQVVVQAAYARMAVEVCADVINRVTEQHAWFAVDRNNRSETAYRIYLSPDIEHAADIFADILHSAPRDIGFQIKTFGSDVGYAEMARSDKIIAYALEESADALLATVREVYARHRGAFFGRLPPPGGLPTEMEGVSVARQSQAQGALGKKTGSEVMAKAIGERIVDQSRRVLLARFGAFRQRPHDVSAHDEGRFLCAASIKLAAQNTWHTEKQWPRPEERHPEHVREEINRAYGTAMYQHAAHLLLRGESEIRPSECYRLFKERLRAVALPDSQRAAFDRAVSVTSMLMMGRDEQALIREAETLSGLALDLYTKRERGMSSAEAFRAFLAGE